jgi:UDP-N-acetylmuramate--alanine ligase
MNRTAIKAAHRYEVVDIMSRLNIAGARYHFIGAGGIGMSGLARFLIGRKAIVTGSDQACGVTTSRLNGLGARIHVGHCVENLDPATDVVVVSAAIDESNPELQMARRRGCRVVKYAQLLGELMNHFEGVAVSGTHGKSTTSGWLVYCLKQAGLDANFVVGADVLQLGGSSGSGDSDVFVVEACEYDRSFHNFKPAVACILNIDRDHLDCYRDEEDIIDSFCRFAQGTRPDGVIVANGEDPNIAKMLGRLSAAGDSCPVARDPIDGSRGMDHGSRVTGHGPQIVTFGLDPRCSFSAANVRENGGYQQFDVFQEGRCLGATRIALAGLHNVRNALAVIAMAGAVGVEPERILEVLDGFQGMDRRLMLKGRFGPAPNAPRDSSLVERPTEEPSLDASRFTSDEIVVLDDYAHHPTEIRATLQAIRQRYRPRRLWCVFQAHQYSRTRALLEEFAHCFAQADKVVIPEIYFARDSQDSCSAVNAGILAERIRRCGTDVEHIATFGAVCDYLEKHVDAGDVVVTMGAGDIWKVADEYIQRLRRNR